MPPNNDKNLALLTASEQRLASFMILCMEDAPKVNFQRLAQLGGYTEASARTLVGNLKRKLKNMFSDEGNAAGDTAGATPKRGKGTKRAAATEPHEENEDMPTSPTKKKKSMTNGVENGNVEAVKGPKGDKKALTPSGIVESIEGIKVEPDADE